VNKAPLYYFDHAAATPLDERVLAAMQPYFTELFFNPSSPYAPAVAVRREYEAAKDTLARTIGARGSELVITAGATESINLAFKSIGGHVVVGATEHQAVLSAAKFCKSASYVQPDNTGLFSAELIARTIRADTELVSIALANNELGTVQPLAAIAAVVERERQRRREHSEVTPLYFHSDASQGLGQLDVHVARLGVDMLTINAAKVYGPKQVGLLWAAPHVQLSPVIVGGGQERGVRSGTENVAGVIGFSRAMVLASEHRHGEAKRLSTLRNTAQSMLEAALPDIEIYGNQKKRLSSHLSLSLPGVDAERLVFKLERQGVYVATGSACAANKGTRSHVLEAIGLNDRQINGSLRLSFGRLTDEKAVREGIKFIIAAFKQEQDRVGKKA